MDVTVLLKNSVITSVELHGACLLVTILLFLNMQNSFTRSGRKAPGVLNAVYLGCVIMLASDCVWTAFSTYGNASNALGYAANMLYFLGSSVAALCWFLFSAKDLNSRLMRKSWALILAFVPYVLVTVMYLLSPFFALIFSIQNGEYIRGSLFFADPIVKMGYIGAASLTAVAKGLKKKKDYLRRQNFDYALFGVTVIFFGILQTVTGVDFNCLGVTCGLVLLYIVGITNQDTENTDAIYSLARSFEASYIVNMDTGEIRPLHDDRMHDREMPGMRSMDYTAHFTGILSRILLPEDRDRTLQTFNLKNVEERFKIDNSFSIRYRVREQSGITAMHSASFIQATNGEGKREFLLGITTVSSDSLLHERNESLIHENERLEQINLSIIESVAKMVEARDGGSGAHIARVKKITEILARELMEDYPELNLDEENIKLISSASVLHDVGKIVIPDAILLKPGKLTPEEYAVMKTHSAKGCDILNMFPLGLDDAFLNYALSICRWHHEKYDGAGYPDGLKGDDIPIAAQIVSLADCFDALVSERPYKAAFSPEQALDMIQKGKCGVFSPKILHVLEKQKGKLTEFVRLHQ